MTKKQVVKRPKPYRASRYGIQNHYGEVWTSETFQTPEQAQKYLDKQRPLYGGLTRKHRVVPVRITVSIDRSLGARQFMASQRPLATGKRTDD